MVSNFKVTKMFGVLKIEAKSVFRLISRGLNWRSCAAYHYPNGMSIPEMETHRNSVRGSGVLKLEGFHPYKTSKLSIIEFLKAFGKISLS